MSADFHQDLVCTYAKGNQCAVGVLCVSSIICSVLNSVHAKGQMSVVISGSSHYFDSHYFDSHNSDSYFSDTHNSDSHYSDTH
jgi:hypothetical protein